MQCLTLLTFSRIYVHEVILLKEQFIYDIVT